MVYEPKKHLKTLDLVARQPSNAEGASIEDLQHIILVFVYMPVVGKKTYGLIAGHIQGKLHVWLRFGWIQDNTGYRPRLKTLKAIR